MSDALTSKTVNDQNIVITAQQMVQGYVPFQRTTVAALLEIIERLGMELRLAESTRDFANDLLGRERQSSRTFLARIDELSGKLESAERRTVETEAGRTAEDVEMEIRRRAGNAHMGDSFVSGPLKGASVYNVLMFAARKIEEIRTTEKTNACPGCGKAYPAECDWCSDTIPRPQVKASECQFCDGLGHEAQKKCVHCDGSGLKASGDEAETPCAIRDDGLHCACWYGGNKCCGCGDGDRTLGGEWPTCAEIRAQNGNGDGK